MSQPKAHEAVIRALSIELQATSEEVRAAGSLRTDLGMDSIAVANILFALEEEFDCELDLDGVRRLDTVADIAEVLASAAA
ncbi:MAG: acyl carrier protein [Candidatus Binatia bacterium]|nr:acyl carrier protein [Candidatus Binatia bacterium]